MLWIIPTCFWLEYECVLQRCSRIPPKQTCKERRWYSMFHSPAGRGIGHQIMCEEGYAFPGTMTASLSYLCYAISNVELREFTRECLLIAVQCSSLRGNSDQPETRLLQTRIQICTGKASFGIVSSCSGLLCESPDMLQRRFAHFGILPPRLLPRNVSLLSF